MKEDVDCFLNEGIASQVQLMHYNITTEIASDVLIAKVALNVCSKEANSAILEYKRASQSQATT